MSEEIRACDYWACVRAIAADVVARYGLDREDWHEEIDDIIFSNEWVTRVDRASVLLKTTSNEPDPEELAEWIGDDDRGDWRTIMRQAATFAMEVDILEACVDAAAELAECERCEGAVRESDMREQEGGELFCKNCHDAAKEDAEKAADIASQG
jgi:hypothetical protein